MRHSESKDACCPRETLESPLILLAITEFGEPRSDRRNTFFVDREIVGYFATTIYSVSGARASHVTATVSR